MSTQPNSDELPTAKAVPDSKRSLPWVWLIPLIAAALGLWLAAQAVLKSGPSITLTFETAEGLEAGKTKIRYKDVDIGEVRSISLSSNREQVVVTADFVKDAADFLVKDTQFWVVKPRISGGAVSGVSTLLSGSYIALKIGDSKEHARHFTGLEVAPILTAKQAGRAYVLEAKDLGSLDVGAPIYFRHIRVGDVVGYQLDPNGRDVHINIFIRAPYDQYVTNETRFWNASGFDVSLDSKGMRLDTESLVSILTGGIAFETAPEDADSTSAEADYHFTLFKNRLTATKTLRGDPQIYMMQFSDSLRGLSAGASVEFRGIQVGEVLSVGVYYDEESTHFKFPVTVEVYPEELGFQHRELSDAERERRAHEILRQLIARGLRAQLRSGSLLTGQLYVALDFFKDAPVVQTDWSRKPIQLPTIPGTLQELEQSVSSILRKLDSIPFEAIGIETRETLTTLNSATHNLDLFIQTLNKDIAPETRESVSELRGLLVELRKTLAPESPLQRDLRRTLNETTRSVQSIRSLADTLESEPESLLRGKTGDDE